ncbi:HesB/IscA family protein [Legionella pneumophila]|uniref:HesB family protein n=1 Tax=Legionella pneumophila subsp. pascullei TaxID=91890 RepID=A0AAX2IXJ1_LEGPN|nr:iron-sulfur cluster assembly accessory protein [Legionella pneumophila]AMP89611.1 iron-sulfur cluster assembly accessory protein [Legionella pneumophila subsp. pascullei]AMP92723.1 heme biosynthesis protein HemY [Legionella pneumophila subsp. pascullei]AMP95690.1 heme biosynthesis protein HemY [Legionella pneumophila subsp. pascullei]SQG90600.1 HesB family protein [Legionella pneumophila subsp. pascullei]VEH07145.1 HesB family protein [Legionella pneumophila subsp. pascullei]
MSVEIQQANSISPNITFSESAIKHLVSYLEQNPGSIGVRLSVKKTGCSGLSYVVDYVKEPLEGDMVVSLSDNYLVCVDRTSYPFLKNMQVDYVKQGLNYKFVFNNPNQTGQCGCGESFTVT